VCVCVCVCVSHLTTVLLIQTPLSLSQMPGLDGLQSFPIHVEGRNLIVTANRDALKDNWRRQPHMCSHRPTDTRVFAIVGAGAAGMECVETLRAEGYTGRIVLYGKEPHVPYDRTKLSKVTVCVKNTFSFLC
jgi:hypothetical protein